MVVEQLFVNGLIAGAIYALVAVGFSLIYSTCKFIHFAHGAVVATAAYFLYFLFSVLGFEFWISVILAIVFAGFVGWLLNKSVYTPLRNRKASSVILLVASLGLLILIES
ncbi:branched-chain amino acid ABC transporter permease, partial [Candidatus Micrarchaeota archaeon]|nr:branched-chain amino acid ABC transporter permease [Candidatus Micrarchaeota archaeon]MBU1930488.1 branched-chain amino acid ABC transporter permease [Candidatus Micrarchaeota archaeon]